MKLERCVIVCVCVSYTCVVCVSYEFSELQLCGVRELHVLVFVLVCIV